MPAEALVYVEISHPGQHSSHLAKLLGLIRRPQSSPNGGAPSGVILRSGIFLPDDLALSPALVTELEKVQGFAVAVTSIDACGTPSGVAVVHLGDSDLLRGLFETGIQFVEPGEPIEGLRTYCVDRKSGSLRLIDCS